MTAHPSLAHRVKQLSVAQTLAGVGNRLTPYLYLTPALFFIGLFVLWPVARAFYNSLYDGNLLFPYREYVGPERYVDLLTNERFHQILIQSAYYLVLMLAARSRPIPLAIVTLKSPSARSAFSSRCFSCRP